MISQDDRAARFTVFARSAGVMVLGLWAMTVSLDSFVETVKITIPAAVGFSVTNVGAATAGSPASGTVAFAQFTGANVGQLLRISVKADSNFAPPGGQAIPASNLSWATSSAANGTGSNGVLSTTVYGQVFQSAATKKAGGVNVSWSLAAPGTSIRAGIHTLTVRWKLESF